MRNEQVQKACAPDLGEAVLGGNKKVGGQRHGFPGDHECIGVIRQQNQTHAREKQVVLQTHQAGIGPRTAAEVPGGENGYPRRGGAEQKQEQTRECVAAHVHGQVGQSDLQDGLLRGCPEARRRHHREGHAAQSTERE